MDAGRHPLPFWDKRKKGGARLLPKRAPPFLAVKTAGAFTLIQAEKG